MNALIKPYNRTQTRPKSSWLTQTLKRAWATLTGPRQTAETTQWEALGTKPIDGVFWVTGECPINGLTRDENGIPAFTIEGDLCRYTALVSIEYHPETGVTDAFPIAPHETGDFDLSYGITHYAPFVTPKPPNIDHINLNA